MIVTGRALRRTPVTDPRRVRLGERQTWHFAAATAWVVSLGAGLLASFAALVTMAEGSGLQR